MSVAVVLEAGGPKGSRKGVEYECTLPLLYPCLDGELAPLVYATVARIVIDPAQQSPTDCDAWWMPSTQFVCHGDEAVEGAANSKIKPFFGGVHQYIYAEYDRIIWMICKCGS